MDSLRQQATAIGTATQRLPSGRVVRIAAWTVRFPPANPTHLAPGTLAGTYTSKPLVDVEGEPLFGELAIARWLTRDGWSAVWADTYHGRKFWSGMPHLTAPVQLPPEVRRLYDQIADRKGSASGCFDVIAWKDGRTILLEYKGPNDRPNKNEALWIDAALDVGIREEDLFFVGAKARTNVADEVRQSSTGSMARSLPERNRSTEMRTAATPVARTASQDMRIDDTHVKEFASERAYFAWLDSHRHGYVLNVRGRKIMLHRARCTHIDRHNNPGALIERDARKLCADDERALVQWAREHGFSTGDRLPECRSCIKQQRTRESANVWAFEPAWNLADIVKTTVNMLRTIARMLWNAVRTRT